MLSKESIDEFKQIYKKVFNKDLMDEQAFSKASNLLNFYKAIYGCCPPADKNTSEKTD